MIPKVYQILNPLVVGTIVEIVPNAPSGEPLPAPVIVLGVKLYISNGDDQGTAESQ